MQGWCGSTWLKMVGSPAKGRPANFQVVHLPRGPTQATTSHEGATLPRLRGHDDASTQWHSGTARKADRCVRFLIPLFAASLPGFDIADGFNQTWEPCWHPRHLSGTQACLASLVRGVTEPKTVFQTSNPPGEQTLKK